MQQICTWLVGRDVKMIVIACNTATAAGLAHAQENFSVPVVGVVEPGARAAAHTTVSYTHLDVYKRQATSSSAAR